MQQELVEGLQDAVDIRVGTNAANLSAFEVHGEDAQVSVEFCVENAWRLS